jgi:hypothetical protein
MAARAAVIRVSCILYMVVVKAGVVAGAMGLARRGSVKIVYEVGDGDMIDAGRFDCF